MGAPHTKFIITLIIEYIDAVLDERSQQIPSLIQFQKSTKQLLRQRANSLQVIDDYLKRYNQNRQNPSNDDHRQNLHIICNIWLTEHSNFCLPNTGQPYKSVLHLYELTKNRSEPPSPTTPTSIETSTFSSTSPPTSPL